MPKDNEKVAGYQFPVPGPLFIAFFSGNRVTGNR
jgi:hypothetical protein